MSSAPKLWTTLNEILQHGPCGQEPDKDGSLYGFLLLKKNLGKDYGDDTPITLPQILESNGVEDALWALRYGMDERFERHLACDFAEHVLPIYEAKYPGDNRPRNAIEVSRRFADGNATEEELRAAWAAALAAWTGAGAAARAALGAGAAWTAARAAAWAAAQDEAGAAAWEAAGAAAWAALRAALGAGRAGDAAWEAGWAALRAALGAGRAGDAAWEDEREWQAQRLRERYEEFTNV